MERSDGGQQVAVMNSTISTSALFLGAPGLVGNHVIPALAEAGIPVLAGSRRGLAVGAAAGVTVDMRDPENLARTMREDRHRCLRDPGRDRYGGTRFERRIRGSICRSEAASLVLQLWREPEK